MYLVVAVSLNSRAAVPNDLIRRVQRAAKLLYGDALIVRSFGPNYLFHTSDMPKENLAEGDFGAVAVGGYCTASTDELTRLVAGAVKKHSRGSKTFATTESPGGVASFFAVTPTECFAWSTVPSCNPVYHATSRSADYSVSSNRPAIVAALCDRVDVDMEYVRWVLGVGYPLDVRTPYAGVNAVPAHHALVSAGAGQRLVEGRASSASVPRNESQRAAAQERFEAELQRAVSVTARFDAPELRLSAGKDSRLLAAVLSHLGIEVTAHTIGANEGAIAQQLADRLGMHLVVDRAEQHDTDPAERIADMLRATDGLVDTESHVAYEIPRPLVADQDAIMYGHSSTAKGGWGQRMGQNKPTAARQRLDSALGCGNLARQEVLRVEEALAGHLARNYHPPIDLLFFPYVEFRAGRYVEPQYLKQAHQFTPLYPLNDERVVSAAADLNRGERTSHRAIYRAISRFAPAALDAALFEDKWKFLETTPAAPPAAAKQEKKSLPKGRRPIGTPFDLPAIREELRSTDVFAMATEVLRPGVLDQLGFKHRPDMPDENPATLPDLAQRQVVKHVQRMYFLHHLTRDERVRRVAREIHG